MTEVCLHIDLLIKKNDKLRTNRIFINLLNIWLADLIVQSVLFRALDILD